MKVKLAEHCPIAKRRNGGNSGQSKDEHYWDWDWHWWKCWCCPTNHCNVSCVLLLYLMETIIFVHWRRADIHYISFDSNLDSTRWLLSLGNNLSSDSYNWQTNTISCVAKNHLLQVELHTAAQLPYLSNVQ